jgi:hypothetical protein
LNAGAGAIQTTGAITGGTFNGLALASLATGFSVAGGTVNKTLTLSDNATLSGTNSGDQTITLTGAVTGTGTGSFATTLTGAGLDNIFSSNGLLKRTGTNTYSVDVSTYLTTTGSAADLTNFPTLNQSTSGNAATATALQNPRSIFGISFDGTADIGSALGTGAYAAIADYLPLSGGTMTGNLLFTDNTSDIGASGATRPRTGYFGTSVVSPLVTASSITTASGDLMLDPAGNVVINGSTADNTAAALNVTNSTPTSLLFVRNDGNIGIGTTSPRALLEVAAATDPVMFVSDGGGSTAKEVFIRYLTTADVGEIGAFQEGGTGAKSLVFQRLGGNVGIGTTSPGAMLDVNGSIKGSTLSGNTLTQTDVATLNGETRVFMASDYTPNQAITGDDYPNDFANGATIGKVAHFTAGWNGTLYLTPNRGFRPGQYDIYVRIRASGGNHPNDINCGVYNQTANNYPLASVTLTGLTTSYQVKYMGRITLDNTIISQTIRTYFSTAGYTTDYYIDYVLVKPAPLFDGNVGIGTTSPGEKLNVFGNIRVSGDNGDVNTKLAAIGFERSSFTPGVHAAEIQFYREGAGDEGALAVATKIHDGSLAEQLRITSTGNVGIGTTNPGAKLEVTGDMTLTSGSTRTISVSSGTSGLDLTVQAGLFTPGDGSGGTLTLNGGSGYLPGKIVMATNGGKVGIGTSPSYQLQLSTDSAAKPGTNAWTVASDARLKTDITPFTDGLSILAKINPVNYTYNGKGGMPAGLKGIGIIAQDMMQAAPYTVSTYRAKLDPNDQSDTDIYNFNSSALTFVMINAIKEQQKEIDGLKLVLNPAGAISNASSTLATADGSGPFAWLANGLNALGLALKDGAASLREVAADTFTAKQANIEQIQNDRITTNQISANQICVKDSGNNDICLTGDQLKELIQKAGASMMSVKTYAPADSGGNVPATTTEAAGGENSVEVLADDGETATTTGEISQDQAAAIVNQIAAETASSTEPVQ